MCVCVCVCVCVCIKEGISDLGPREEKGSHHQKLGVGKPGAIFQTEGRARRVALRLVCGRVSEQGLWAVGTVRILSCESQETTGVFRGKGHKVSGQSSLLQPSVKRCPYTHLLHARALSTPQGIYEQMFN